MSANLDDLIWDRTRPFALEHLDRTPFVEIAFFYPVIAVGEHHGIRQTQAFSRRLLEILPDFWQSVLVHLRAA